MITYNHRISFISDGSSQRFVSLLDSDNFNVIDYPGIFPAGRRAGRSAGRRGRRASLSLQTVNVRHDGIMREKQSFHVITRKNVR